MSFGCGVKTPMLADTQSTNHYTPENNILRIKQDQYYYIFLMKKLYVEPLDLAPATGSVSVTSSTT